MCTVNMNMTTSESSWEGSVLVSFVACVRQPHATIAKFGWAANEARQILLVTLNSSVQNLRTENNECVPRSVSQSRRDLSSLP